MTTYARQASVMQTTQDLALEGFMHFLRVHEGKAKDYPDYVKERLSAIETLGQLAKMEEAFGHEKVRGWLEESAAKADAKLQGAA